ncbi:kinesin-like protein Klp61F [Ceratina calcarata]|uniref:Kinesin-like protein Klp61F n=1 Tax=Ceratina calcarata TaxID=156304 RepID=A0AAJ7WAD4_9HYME|nr:kinesin-like protein Klp61F [Ceratina calcarata]
MNDTKSEKKERDRGQHIQVFARVRPINDLEKNNKSKNIIEIPNDKELIVHERLHDKFSKKFRFDHVFGPSSKQIELYNIVISPLVEHVLAGYNCTVLAYGQTGTGKTFTMEGDSDFSSTLNWQADSSAGMIPRAISHLFDKLQLLKAQEYNIRVSFLELYNEELFDLLSPNGDSSKMRLYEDASKKGAIIIHGLEEITIQNKNEVYRILEKGSEKRQTTATLMNAQSSRSHTVFSITVHMKESTAEGDDVLKTGKLNLVDLAGSENVGRSGAVDRRAKEAGSINQSLLTLGRVITALVERTLHIPYRESKLTRLLQESLGGRTKTSIIATISPASVNVDETISTLDYAHRAKNIKNRPEINQKLSKKEFLKQYTEEIEKLQRDLLATRERTGVYLADENYRQLQSLMSQQTKEIEAKINHIKALEKSMADKERLFKQLELQNMEQTKKLHEVKMKLNNASAALDTTNQRLKLSAQERDEQKYLVEKYVNTERSLLNHGQTLLNVANTATEDSYKLHDKIARKNETERALEAQGERFRNNVCEYLRGIQSDVLAYTEELKESFTSMTSELDMETFFIYENMQRIGNQLSTVLSEEHLPETNNLVSNINESVRIIQTFLYNSEPHNISHFPLYIRYIVTHQYSDTFRQCPWISIISYLFQYSHLQNEAQIIATNQVTTMESQNKLISKKFLELAASVEDMINNDILTNLMAMRNSVFEKLKETSETINKLIDSSCEQQLKIYNETCENVLNVQENVKIIREMQKSTEKQQLFSEMMENAYSQLNDLKRSEEKHCTNVREKCDRLHELCNEFNDQTADSYNANTEMRNELREQVREGIERIENDVIVSTKQVNYSLVESQVMIGDVSNNQAAFINDKIIEISDTTKATSEKLETRMTEFTARNNNVVEKLEQLESDIYKFFTQDMQREVPTGTTPSKREFSYPRQFTTTSPHERILQRFRETKKLVERPEYDEDSFMVGDTPLRHLANSTAMSDITLTTSPPDNTTLVTSNDSSIYTSTNSTIMNITRTSDISRMSVNSDAASGTGKDFT